MPPQHQAVFDPIPPDLDLNTLVEKTQNFDWVERIKLDDVKRMGWVEFEKLVSIQVLHGGRPLIVEGWNADLQPWLYSADWLKTNMGKKVEAVRDITKETNYEMTIGHYLDNMGKLAKAMTPEKYREEKRQRLYLKDIDCPTQWREQLKGMVPKFLFYMNENVSEIGEPGSTTFKNGVGQELQTQGIAPAGDLMSHLPPEMRAENLQMYIGHEGTYTPAHKEMCGTSSQNIMVETSSTLKDGEKDGSSIWFMTEAQDREVVSEYFLSMLGHDIDIEKHFAQVVAWKKAPFPVFICEQKVGDLVLVPPLAPHQVWNRGNRTIKVAWNRTTVDTLEFALAESLPRARMVCRDEQYRVKATVYYSLVKYYGRLRDADAQDEQHEFTVDAHKKVWDSFRLQILKDDFTRLAKLFADIMVAEMFSPDLPKERDVEYLPFEGNVTCSYCRCNIFNRFLTCKSCVEELVNGDEDTYDVCMDCYAMGRSCACISNLSWVEQWRWAELVKKYDEYHDLVRFITFDPERWILPLAEERTRRGRKTTAEVCQEQLKRRPWQDIKNPDPAVLSDIETDPEDEDFKKRMGGKRRRPKAPEVLSKKPCHICKKPDKPWKLAECTICDAAYCYGSLWRAFDLKPEEIMKHPNWKCPDCLDICSCALCQRKHPHRAVYEPKATLLGHDTKAVADPRSVESLVDFSRTNLAWLRDNDTNPKKTKRMQRLIEEAKAKKIEYYRYAAEQWGLDPDTYGPQVLGGYPRETTQTNGDILASGTAADGSQVANDSGLDISHRRTMSPSFDHVAPVATMGAMAPPPPPYNNAGYTAGINPYQTQNEGSSFQPINRNNVFVSPNELMHEPPAAYSDALTSAMPEEHLQPQARTDVDENGILFQDPDDPASATSDRAVADSAYPRLPHETEEDGLRKGLTAGQKKRKRQSMLVDGDMNQAHKEFILTEQRKKLAAARKEGRFYMTQGQLLGGEPFMVTLKVPNKKTELAAMAEIDAGGAALRHNPREARTSNAHRGSNGMIDLDAMDVDEEEDDEDIVKPDVRQRVIGEVEPERPARPIQPPQSPEQSSKTKRRGRPRMRLPSLEPGAVPYEATKKGKLGRSRKSRGGDDDDEEQDDPFEDRYPSPKRKKSVAKTPVSSGRPRGRPRKSTEKAMATETLEIFDDELDSEGEIVQKRQPTRRVSAPIQSPQASPKAEKKRKPRQSAAAVMQSTEPPASARGKRSRGSEVEFDHTMLPRSTKRRREATSMSNSVAGGGAMDGAGSGAEMHADNYISLDDHTDDEIMGPPKSFNKRQSIAEAYDNEAMELFDGGEPMTIPMADDDAEFDRPAFSPKPKYAYSDSEDTLAAPSPSKQLTSELDAQSVREQSERQATVESMHSQHFPAPSVDSPGGGYRMADMMPSSSPERHRRSPIRPVSVPADGYRMGDYSDEGSAAEEVPTAGPSGDEDDDLNAKIAAMREIEEEQERARQEAERVKREAADAAAKRKADTEIAKAEQRRLAREEMEREIAQDKAKTEGEKRAEQNRMAMLLAEQEADEEERVAEIAEEQAAEAAEEARQKAQQESVSVASDDSALEDDGDSDIEGEPASAVPKQTSTSITEPAATTPKESPLMSMAERCALQGKSGTFKVAPKRMSTLSVILTGLTPQQRKRYSVSTVGAEESGEETSAVKVKKEKVERDRAGSAVSGTPGGGVGRDVRV